jgi:2-oxoisovalerate dehydrogenase E2 component (dihydrolipoyl transacylase)
MPVIEAGMQEAVLADVFVDLHARVTRGQPLFCVEADKVDLEIESPVDGMVVEISAPVGSELAAGAVVLVLQTDGSTGHAVAEA